jgi:hypothetical protein
VEVDLATAQAQRLMCINGINALVTQSSRPLHLEARVISGWGRRYLKLIENVDQLLLMLNTLTLHRVITEQELGVRVKQCKRDLIGIVRAVRKSANSLREQAGKTREQTEKQRLDAPR